jgi:hypothetical protein
VDAEAKEAIERRVAQKETIENSIAEEARHKA